MGGKSKAPPPPDYSGVAAASQASAKYAFDLGQQQLAWAKETYAKDRAVSDQVIQDAMTRQDTIDQQAAADRARYTQKFQPLEDQLVKDAADYASPERQTEAAGRAQADVSTQFNLARTAAQDRLESFGIDPSQTRAGALDVSSRIAEATARAGAGNVARDRTIAHGEALRSEAINVGRGYPGQIAQQYGLAMQSGNQAANTGLATTASGASTMGTGAQWQGIGNQAVAGWGNALNQGYTNAIAGYKANNEASSGWGSLLGTLGGMAGKVAIGTATGGLGYFAAEGGAIPAGPEPGGPIPSGPGVPIRASMSPSGGAAVDDVPARLNAGEFVVPADVVRWKGEEFFQRQIEGSRKKKGEVEAKPRAGAIPVEAPVVDTTRALPVG